MDQRCPFEVCYINATVLDGKGRRMSKQAGNGIDPIEMIDKYGADAVRYSLILLTKEGQDVKLSPERFEQGYRFSNKVWNAARFVLMNMKGEKHENPTSAAGRANLRLEDRWILSRLARVRAQVSEAFDGYQLNDAAMALVPIRVERPVRLVRRDREGAPPRQGGRVRPRRARHARTRARGRARDAATRSRPT